MYSTQTAPRAHLLIVFTMAILAVGPASAEIVGFLSTPDGMGSGAEWATPPDGSGFRIDWVIDDENYPFHYSYTLSAEDGSGLTPATSHIILGLSEDIGENELFNFTGVLEVEFGLFGPGGSNPGFPDGESIWGVKLGLDSNGGGAFEFSFNATRLPMWVDTYSKGGTDAFAYNTHLGVPVANQHNYWEPPMDDNGRPLFKILAPNQVPEPAAVILLILGVAAIWRRR